MKRRIKSLLKKSSVVHEFLASVLAWYLRFVYFTTKWKYIGDEEGLLDSEKQVIFVMWHNNLAIAPYAFGRRKASIYSLVSGHSDGRIIASVIHKLGYKTISGSTNKGAFSALRAIISHLKDGKSIMITPDGPRGPVYKVNSSIAKIAHAASVPIVPARFRVSNFFSIKSWDKLTIPLPFGSGVVSIGRSIDTTKSAPDNEVIECAINSL